jgi:hypothetical protein
MSGDGAVEQVAVTADRAGKGPHMDDVAVDVGHLSDGMGRGRSDDYPGTLSNDGGVWSLIDEPPGKAGVILRTQIKGQIDADVAHKASRGPESGS